MTDVASNTTSNWTVTTVSSNNPAISGLYADPDIKLFNNKYYIYPTTDGYSGWSGTYFKAFSSYDMVHWKDEGCILNLKTDVPWATEGYAWAPTMLEHNGTYYFFFCGKDSTGASQIGLATGSTPTGPFKAGSTPFITLSAVQAAGLSLGQCIDPSVFTDDDGSNYLVFGNGSPCIVKLDFAADGTVGYDSSTLKNLTINGTGSSTSFTESGEIVKRQGTYYFIWSNGDTRQPTYNVDYGTASTLYGPYACKGNILAEDTSNNILATGHQSVIQIPGTDNWYIAYARFAMPAPQGISGTDRGWNRETCIDKMTFDSNGNINPVTPTLQGIMDTSGIIQESIPQADADEFSIPNSNDIRGNITLLSTGSYGSTITWASSAPDIISTATYSNANYAPTPAGVVTRPVADTQVTLTGTFAYNGQTAQKSYSVTIKAAGQAANQQKYAGYLYTYFSGDSRTDAEQVYFAVSKDATHWKDLNQYNPVLTATLGTFGARDCNIVRSPEGDKFYLLSTDLRIASTDWTTCQARGSRALEIWESDDLVHWSNERLVTLAPQTAGDLWALEAIYDEKTGEYVVYFASKVDGIYNIYICKTRDFYTFTAPQLYIHRSNNVIDTTITKANGVYYRFCKDENAGTVTEDWSPNLLDYSNATGLGNSYQTISQSAVAAHQGSSGIEGPTCFKLNGQNEWCLMVDQFATNGGYLPFLSGNIAQANSFQVVPSSQYLMASGSRHGTVIPITQGEYDALTARYGTAVNNQPAQANPVLSYTFDETQSGSTVKDQSGNGYAGTLNGTAAYASLSDTGHTHALSLDGSSGSYLSFPTGFFDGRDEITISMDIKTSMTNSTNFFTLGIGQNSTRYLFLKSSSNLIRSSLTMFGSGAEGTASTGTLSSSPYTNTWVNVKIIIDKNLMRLYVNNSLVSTAQIHSVSELGSNLLGYIGKSFYSADSYFNGYIDNVNVYNYPMYEDTTSLAAEVATADSLLASPPAAASQSALANLNSAISAADGVIAAAANNGPVLDEDISNALTKLQSAEARVSGGSDATLSSIDIDEVPLANFDPNKTAYSVTVPDGTMQYPIVSAAASDANASVDYSQASHAYPTATVYATASDSVTAKAYTVTFTQQGSTPSNYTITATAGAGGSISPGGVTTVAAGGSQTYTITPDSGYAVADVQVNGTSVGAVNTYTVSNVTANTTIAATFTAAVSTPSNYTITATAGAGGSISPGGVTTVAAGGSQTYTITPDSGYHIQDVTVNGSSVGAVSTYTVSDASQNLSIRATFEADEASASSNANLSGIFVGGTALAGFAPGTLNYTVTLPAGTTVYPEVAATPSDPTAAVSVTQATQASPVAAITVTAGDGHTVETYTVTFRLQESGGGSSSGGSGSSGGSSASSITVTGTATTNGSGQTVTTATIPTGSLTANSALTVTASLGSVTVTAPASVLAAALGSNTSASLSIFQANSTASTQQAAFGLVTADGAAPVASLDIGLNVVSNGTSTAVHQLSGDVAVSIQLTAAQMAQLTDPSTVHLYYYDTSTTPATLTDMNASYDSKTGIVTFNTNHFSTYVIVQGGAAASYTPGVSYAAHVQNIGWQKFAADGAETGTEHRALRMEAVQVKLTGTLPAGASIVYQGHVQNKGWLTSVSDGAVGGTTGKGLRLEALRITLKGLTGYAVKYRAYVQNKGWLDWVTTANGTDISKASVVGTTGKGLRMEALEIQIVKIA